MDITKISDNGLLSFHLGVREAAASDLAREKRGDNSEPYYGVKEFADWSLWRDSLEQELKRRGIDYDPVTW